MSFERYYLIRNPFSTERHDYPIVGRERTLNELRYHINRMIGGGGPHFIVIKGGYGWGKTRILFELVSQLRSETSDFLTENNVLIPDRPIRTLPPRPPTTYLSKYLLAEIFRRIGLPSLLNIKQQLDEYCTENDIAPLELLNSHNIDRHLARSFLNINGEYQEYAWRWFLCETLSSRERRLLGEVQRISTEEMAERIFVDFLRIISILDYNAFILPLDEFEYITIQTRSKQISYLEAFRSLYDRIVEEITVSDSVAALIIIYASTPSGWDDINTVAEAEPFLDRVHRDRIFLELTPFDDDQIRDFIITRLEKDRLPDVQIPNATFPFEDDYLLTVSDYSAGKPRVISSYCYIVLDEGIHQEQDTISGSFANGVLRDLGLIIEAIPVEELM